MKPETDRFLQKAQEFLRKAGNLLSKNGWPDEAGRAAYLAGFHAAQGLLFEKTGKIFKTHKGVQIEFARLVKDDPRYDIKHRAFLGQTYNLKAIADYETGPDAQVTEAQAIAAIAAARLFVAHLAGLLAGNQP